MDGTKKQYCDIHRSRRSRHLLTTTLLVVLLAGITALVLYLVYRPSKPQASVARASVYSLANVSSPPPYALSASMQFTVLLHNPNDRAAVFYDRLASYVTYRDELVTPPAQLPPVLQERGADIVLSPLLGGAVVPVSADTLAALAADCAARHVLLRLVVMGRLKYMSGLFRSGWHELYVRCDVAVGLGEEELAAAGGSGHVPLLDYPQCAVDA